MPSKPSYERVAAIVKAAGGKIVGRTRLQKLVYFMEIAGFTEGFLFEYRLYGPYSEQLTRAAESARILRLLTEEERSAAWGGVFSVFSVRDVAGGDEFRQGASAFAKKLAQADSIELELAATAVFLHKEGVSDPWREAKRRKPEKSAGGRLERAKFLYQELRQFKVPVALPQI